MKVIHFEEQPKETEGRLRENIQRSTQKIDTERLHKRNNLIGITFPPFRSKVVMALGYADAPMYIS